jgi:hypothetical protein
VEDVVTCLPPFIGRRWVHNNTNIITEETLQLLEVVLKQNYFQNNNQLFQPVKGITIGSPTASTIAEIYLQFLEEMHIKYWLENKEIIYYKRYVDDILIINKRTKDLKSHK